jgi:enamine deaminase RidA (YjgF/YER057c/UK114 family)
MIDRQIISSGARWEPICGYSRAVRVGRWVSVAGTTAAAADGSAVGGDDLEAQAREVFLRIRAALEQAGSSLEHVVRTRVFVTDITRWEEAGRVHAEFFGHIRPASSMVEVKALIGPSLLIEVEADAIIPEGNAQGASREWAATRPS